MSDSIILTKILLFENSSKLELRKENVSRIIYSFAFSAAINFLADITTDAVRTIPAPSSETQFAFRSQK